MGGRGSILHLSVPPRYRWHPVFVVSCCDRLPELLHSRQGQHKLALVAEFLLRPTVS